LPAGWDRRLTRLQLAPEVAAWFLEPHDAVVSKYARMEPRDRHWIRPGLKAGVLTLAIIEARFADTTFVDAVESDCARRALDEDRRWLGRPRRGTYASPLPVEAFAAVAHRPAAGQIAAPSCSATHSASRCVSNSAAAL
jgi:hypothetical protein